MKHKEELQAALVVISVFALAMLALLFILKWDDFICYVRRKVREEWRLSFCLYCILCTD